MNSSTLDSIFRWVPYWVLAFVALWPTVGIAKAVMSLGAVFGYCGRKLSIARSG